MTHYYRRKVNLPTGGSTYYHYKLEGGKRIRISKQTFEAGKMATPNYSETVSEPWFSMIQLGLKTVEGRKNKGRFAEMQVGDVVEWKNETFMPRSFLTRVTGKSTYKTFKEYLETEGIDKCLPGIEKYGMEHALSVYYKYFTKEDEKEYGVVAIGIEVMSTC